jgi:hypothetical protein
MKLLIRRELASSQHGLARKTKTRFITYARLELTEEERKLTVTFDLADAVLVTSPGDVVRGEPQQLPHDVAELVNGTEISSPSFAELLSLEERLHKGCEKLKEMFEAARQVSTQHEAVFEF